jgi:uncharacterized protein YegL
MKVNPTTGAGARTDGENPRTNDLPHGANPQPMGGRHVRWSSRTLRAEFTAADHGYLLPYADWNSIYACMRNTIVTCLLDRSGSMETIKNDTIGSFNEYVDTLRRSEAAESIEFTLVMFDTRSMDTICVREPVANAPLLNTANFVPRGRTPLIEATFKTIKAVEKSLDDDGSDTKVVVSILTDGEENSSKPDFTWDSLKALVTEKAKVGWQFDFLGAGIDAYQQSARMGISAASTMSYNHRSKRASAEAFRARASNTAMFAAGRATSTAYTAKQKTLSGDRFADRNVDLGDPIVVRRGRGGGRKRTSDGR